MKVKKLKEGEVADFWANPFYDDVIIFRDNVPTSQDRLKPIDESKRLFELIEHNSVTEFKKSLQARLKEKMKPGWPYTENLYMAIGLTGFKKDLENKDIDNILKPLFDALKGIVFVDDKQIVKLSAEKTIHNRILGVAIGIKKLGGSQDIQLCPFMWCSDLDKWEEERNEKTVRGQHTYMDNY